MTGTHSPVGVPVSIGGLWYEPPRIMVQASLGADGRWFEPWRA
jgi:hypothetical protein